MLSALHAVFNRVFSFQLQFQNSKLIFFILFYRTVFQYFFTEVTLAQSKGKLLCSLIAGNIHGMIKYFTTAIPTSDRVYEKHTFPSIRINLWAAQRDLYLDFSLFGYCHFQ